MRKLSISVTGFIQSSRISVSGTLYESIIKYILSPLVNQIYYKEEIENWCKLYESLINKEKFILVLLTSARYDLTLNAINILKKRKILLNNLEVVQAKVPREYTLQWMPVIFNKLKGARVFYPALNVGVHNIDRIIMRSNMIKNNEVIRISSSLENLNTVHPKDINDAVLKYGIIEKTIIWYAQPHFPWLSDKELSQKLWRYSAIHELVPGDIIKYALSREVITQDRVFKAYFMDLLMVFKYIVKLLDLLKNKDVNNIVITSIHGELLGEYDLYHHKNFNLPQLRVVPWIIIK